MRLSTVLLLSISLFAIGCDPPPKPYGIEHALELPGAQTEVWAVAPAVNLSGHREVDPILQADLLFQELQQVHGMTAVPVDRVVGALAELNIDHIHSAQEARKLCQTLQVDALLVPTVTAYDPYDPPKMAASLVLFRRGELGETRQVVGIYDAGDGSVRQALLQYAQGRSDPDGPMAEREYFLSMDRYAGFVYHQLIAHLLGVPAEPPPAKSK